MKKINILLLGGLTISIMINIFQYNFDSNAEYNKENGIEIGNNQQFKQSCYIAFANYFVNPEGGMEFTLPPVKECLINEVLNEGYNMNGMIDKVLLQLQEFQNTYPNSSVLEEYKNQLKKNFEHKIDVLDRGAIKIALEIIGDKEFEEKLLENGIIK